MTNLSTPISSSTSSQTSGIWGWFSAKKQSVVGYSQLPQVVDSTAKQILDQANQLNREVKDLSRFTKTEFLGISQSTQQLIYRVSSAVIGGVGLYLYKDALKRKHNPEDWLRPLQSIAGSILALSGIGGLLYSALLTPSSPPSSPRNQPASSPPPPSEALVISTSTAPSGQPITPINALQKPQVAQSLPLLNPAPNANTNAPPKPPSPTVSSTNSTVQDLNWESLANPGSSIRAAAKTFENWQFDI